MKNAVVACLLLIAAVSVAVVLTRDPVVEARAQTPRDAGDLATRVADLEEFISLHSHEPDLQEIRNRIEQLESSALRERATGERERQSSASAGSRSTRTPPNRELQSLKRDVQSLTSKLSSLERKFAPINQDIAKLKLGLSRLESSVAGIDLRR